MNFSTNQWISNDLQKLPKYISRTTIFAFRNASLAAGFSKIVDLYLKYVDRL